MTNRIAISLTQADVDAINAAIEVLAARFQPILIALKFGNSPQN